MGNSKSRVLQISNVEDRLAECLVLGTDQCPIYGKIHKVQFKGMDFNIGESVNQDIPHPMSLHYLVRPKMLLFPDFVLLEDINPASIDDLLEIIKGVSEMAAEGGELGVGYQRIGYRSRWGVVGEIDSDWTYQQVLENNSNTHGIYFSPQQMIALSQRQPSPKYDRSKSDVFAFGIMLLEIVFQESLASIYDYTNFEILLNPLLEKLQRVKEEEGESLAAMFIAMLEIEEEDRVDFAEVLDLVDAMIKPQPKALPQLSTYMLNSNNSQRMDQSRGTKGANRANGYATQLTPKAAGEGNYRNDVSPFRGRFGANVKVPDRLKLTPERSPQSRSPMRQGKTPRQDLFGRATAFPQGGDYQQPRYGISPRSRR